MHYVSLERVALHPVRKASFPTPNPQSRHHPWPRWADRIYGKAGADRLYGGKDRKKDFLYGGRGNEWIVIRRIDRVYAGRGNDVVVRPDYSGMYLLYVWCGPGYDKVLANPWLRAGGNDCEKWE